MVICLERGADRLHMVQLMASCIFVIEILNSCAVWRRVLHRRAKFRGDWLYFRRDIGIFTFFSGKT